MALDLQKFLTRFIEEARDHISRMNIGLLGLEDRPDDAQTLNDIFRSAHTLKGSSRMMKLNAVAEVAHRLEEVLDALRAKKIRFSKDLCNLLLSGVDTLSELVEQAAMGTAAGATADIQGVCNALGKAARGDVEKSPDGATAAAAEAPGTAGPVLHSEEAAQPPQESASAREGKEGMKPRPHGTIRVNPDKLDNLIKLVGEMVSGQSRFKQRLFEIREMEKLTRRSAALLSELQDGRPSPLRDEIVAAIQTLHSGLKLLASSSMEEASHQDHLIHDLQESALSMRMVPLSSIFDSFHRIVRDLSSSLGKEIQLLVEGGETELDRKIVDKIGDPVIHMIRNAIDHGIEGPEERMKAGKPRVGTIRLSARYEGESVLIELSDDGAGISMPKIRERALQKRMYDADEIIGVTDSELTNLIFQPGFSTSEIITDLSGRGVGMDVVKKNIIEDLKGSIRIETREGAGTTFYIRLLLTLAIMHVLLVAVSDMVFALPTNLVDEIVRIKEDEIIDVVDRKAIRLREQIIPVLTLGHVLGIGASGQNGAHGMLVLIISMGGERLGLIVDSLLNEEDAVIKPLPPHMQNVRFVSGVTMSGRNEIINVLDVSKIVEAAKEMKYERNITRIGKEEKRAMNVLVVDDSINTREIEKSILEAYGYKVTLAGDGIEALEKAMDYKYDVIVTDIEMPRMDGFSFTERLRQDEEYRDTPIILVTSRDREEDKRRGIQVGANAYIVKGSFDQANLVDTIQNLAG